MTSAGSRSTVHWTRAYSAPERPGERARERGLADAGVVLDQDVALGEQGDEQVPHHLVADLDGPLDVRLQPRAGLRHRDWIELRQRGHVSMVRAGGGFRFNFSGAGFRGPGL